MAMSIVAKEVFTFLNSSCVLSAMRQAKIVWVEAFDPEIGITLTDCYFVLQL
jgi:hypothetical protein